MSKHTPTPLPPSFPQNFDLITIRKAHCIKTGPMEYIYVTGENAEANAAHIVKCVNLHEEIVDLLEKSEHAICQSWSVGFCSGRDDLEGEERAEKSLNKWQHKVRAVLAKAKGAA